MPGKVGHEPAVIAIVGAGAMGRGIAQVAATGGMTALLFDAAADAAVKAKRFIGDMLDRQVARGRMDEADAAAANDRVRPVEALTDLKDADLVIEAIIENLDVKRDLFRALEDIVAETAPIASNTSSIRIASIAAGCRHRGRIAGMHFFNPVPLMRLVEIIRAPDTEAEVLETLAAVGRRMGREPVIVQDSPGFLVNLGGRAFTTEALRIASEGVATPAEIDAVMKDCWGFRMGPFELMDLTGIDVNFPVSQIIHQGYFGDRRLATTTLHQNYYESGRFGRKTGRGFYNYDESGDKVPTRADAASDGPPASKVVLAEPDAELEALLQRAGLATLNEDDGESPIAAAPVGEDCTAVAVRLDLDARRLFAIDTLSGTDRRITIMTPPGAGEGVAARIIRALSPLGVPVTTIKDSPGFIGQRITAMVANLGAEMAQIGIASPADIDKGMTLGLNYPQGPLAMANAVGPETVLAILEQLQEITGDDRYRPSQWLRRRALLGFSMETPD